MHFFVYLCEVIRFISEMAPKEFEHKVKEMRTQALSAALGFGFPMAEAEDVAQDVMLRLWAIHERIGAEDPVGWLAKTAARHACIDRLRATHPEDDAVLRYYQYTLYTRPVALMREYGWECGSLHLDLELMEQEAQSFLGEHDFIDFCIPRNDGKSTLCTLTEFRLERVNDWTVVFHIKGNRFLHRQVRAMVGTLFDIGRGRYPAGTIQSIFEKKFKGERTWAPPQGLVLQNVEYRDY